MVNVTHFAITLFRKLNEDSFKYAVVGDYDQLPCYVNHDIDMWVEDLKKAFEIIYSVAQSLGYVIFINNKTTNGYNLVFYSSMQTTKFIKIDIFSELAYKSFIVLVDKRTIRDNAIPYKGFYIVDPALEYKMDLMYYMLERGTVYKKGRNLVRVSGLKSEQLIALLTHVFGKRRAHILETVLNRQQKNEIEGLLHRYRKIFFIRSVGKLKNIVGMLRFVFNNITRLLNGTGHFWVFIGIDGAGKTTIINYLKDNIQPVIKDDKFLSAYWRPLILPPLKTLFKKNETVKEMEKNIALPSVAVLNKKSPCKLLFYYAKYFYYFLDFILGYISILPKKTRGGLVLFDRYYYDMELMPERFDFYVPRFLMHLFSVFIPKPDLIFFLWSEPEVIHTRKIEYTAEQITKQIDEYKSLFEKNKRFIMINTNKSIELVFDQIILSAIDKARR